MKVNPLDIAREVTAARSGGPAVVLATVISAPEGAVPIGSKLLLRADGSRLGGLDGGGLDEAVVAVLPEVLRRHRLQTYYFTLAGEQVSRSEAGRQPVYQVMIEPHEPTSKLVVVGGGHIGKALAEIGKLCDFHVAVIDDRPDYANRERFPDIDEVICGDFVESLRNYPIDGSTYVVCVTRGHKHDEMSLRQVVDSPAAYIGMIGSRRRVSAVLQHIIEDGADPQAVAGVHTPIGLDIGAETPEEIAVSIMAEIIQVRRGGSGQAMKEVKRARKTSAPTT